MLLLAVRVFSTYHNAMAMEFDYKTADPIANLATNFSQLKEPLNVLVFQLLQQHVANFVDCTPKPLSLV